MKIVLVISETSLRKSPATAHTPKKLFSWNASRYAPEIWLTLA
jgi:hypothetical protein